MKRTEKLSKERSKKRAAKELAMQQPGYKSAYFKRHEARSRGEPMKARQYLPWWHNIVMSGFAASEAERKRNAEGGASLDARKYRPLAFAAS